MLITPTQNRCLHLWFTQIGDELNGAGYTVKMVYNHRAIRLLNDLTGWIRLTPMPDVFKRKVLSKLSEFDKALTFGDIDWTPVMVKDLLWRPLSVTMYDKVSTTKLTSIEVQKIFEQLYQLLSLRFGISVEWPSEEELKHHALMSRGNK